MQLQLNYQCKQCFMRFGVQDKPIESGAVALVGISFKRVVLQVDDHTRSYPRFMTHTCHSAQGLCEFVGWEVLDND